MSIITILFFFVYTYGLGFSVTFFFKNSDNFFERNLMRIGIGLGILPFLLVLFNFLHVPVDWRIVLLASLIIPLFVFVKKVRNGLKLPNIKFTKSNLYLLILLLIFFLTLFMYVKGAFRYPYFEDDDPWAHATGVKYVSIENNLDDPHNNFKYIKPYPPGYDALMAVLHQTSPSIMWTMKFFNALIISLGIIFFYFFVKDFMHNSDKSLIATIILAMVPCYLSHFIWAHSLVVTLLIVALYCLIKIDDNKNWIYVLSLILASVCLVQPTQPMKFFIIFMIFILVKSFYLKKFCKYEFFSVIGGYLLSLIWWANNWRDMFAMSTFGKKVAPSIQGGPISKSWNIITRIFPPDQGTATRPYTFWDFFIARKENLINSPVGVGVVICFLVLISFIVIFLTYKSMKERKRIWIVTSLFWLLFTFLGINSMTFNLPVGSYAFRFWILFAIPLSIIAAEGFWFLVLFFSRLKVPKIVTMALLVYLIFLTSGQQKYIVNTAMWGPGQMWTSMEEVTAYVWLKNLPPNTKVFAYSSDEQVIGFDKYSCMWCDNVIDFRKNIIDKNVSELYSFLKKERYKYLLVDGMAFRDFGELYGQNKTNEFFSGLLRDIGSSASFQLVYQTEGAFIFSVV